MDFTIRPMSRADLDLALDWAAAEGWNPGLNDAACFHAADPQGFLMGRVGDEPVASISVVRYGAHFAFLGLYIVRPDWRGRGLGWRLWQAGMQSLAGRCVGLDGVLAQQANYRQSGFALAWRNVRYEGVGGGDAPASSCLRPLAGLSFTALAQGDRRFFPAEREAFLRCWIAQPGTTALGWVAEGELRGYGVLRPCRSGFKIGPLFADTPAIADGLYRALAAAAGPGQPVFLDLPEPHAQALALAARHGLRPVFETARMYTGPVPAQGREGVYGITSFELG